MKKLYRKLTPEQKKRGVIFSSSLSVYREETDTIHEVLDTTLDKWTIIGRLRDDKFFNSSHFNYNIIRT